LGRTEKVDEMNRIPRERKGAGEDGRLVLLRQPFLKGLGTNNAVGRRLKPSEVS
jgi:hypothetical protein